jgi:Ti-type conjugative transfer relaxase TraA
VAIYSLHVKAVSRSTGRSVVAAAAYRAAENIVDDRLGVVWDFTAKRGVLHSEIITPVGAPEWARDRAELWNAAERAEDKSTRRSSATTGRDIILALPHELNDSQRLDAVRQFAAALVERYGVAVDFAIHAPDRHSDERNFHAHLLMTTRRIGPDGFGAKTRELDDYTTGPREIEAIRATWERIGNLALEKAGVDIRIDCRSFEGQGVDREATVHLGPIASGMERNGEATDLGDRNRTAQARNAERERIDSNRATVSAEIIDLAAERETRAEDRELRAAIRTHNPGKILETLTARRSTFTRGDLNRVLAKVVDDPKERGALTQEILASPEVVGLKDSAAGPVARYTSRTVLADEERVIADAAALAGRRDYGIERGRGDGIPRGHQHLNEEQRSAVRHATGQAGLALIAGEAGTGKTATLAAVRDAYGAAGYRIIGMGWTNTVVDDLRRDGFRNAATIASELRRLETGASQWDHRTVLIVDEAAMISTRHLAFLTAQARRAGAKLVLAGDDRQLASVERGGLFGALKERHGAAELHEVVRVSDAEQKRAFNLMHRGEFLPALAIYARQGSIRWHGTQDQAREALVASWATANANAPDKSRFVFAVSNQDVDRLNAELRVVQRAQGRLGIDHRLETVYGQLEFATGDRVQFTATDKRRGLFNGAAGTVQAIEGARVMVQLDGRTERILEVDTDEFKNLRHGYAGTIYKGQGRTLDQTFLYHSPNWRAASSYVGLTRHRDRAELFVATETARDLGQLARQMARIDETRAASQFYRVDQPEQGITLRQLLTRRRDRFSRRAPEPRELSREERQRLLDEATREHPETPTRGAAHLSRGGSRGIDR